MTASRLSVHDGQATLARRLGRTRCPVSSSQMQKAHTFRSFRPGQGWTASSCPHWGQGTGGKLLSRGSPTLPDGHEQILARSGPVRRLTWRYCGIPPLSTALITACVTATQFERGYPYFAGLARRQMAERHWGRVSTRPAPSTDRVCTFARRHNLCRGDRSCTYPPGDVQGGDGESPFSTPDVRQRRRHRRHGHASHDQLCAPAYWQSIATAARTLVRDRGGPPGAATLRKVLEGYGSQEALDRCTANGGRVGRRGRGIWSAVLLSVRNGDPGRPLVPKNATGMFDEHRQQGRHVALVCAPDGRSQLPRRRSGELDHLVGLVVLHHYRSGAKAFFPKALGSDDVLDVCTQQGRCDWPFLGRR